MAVPGGLPTAPVGLPATAAVPRLGPEPAIAVPQGVTELGSGVVMPEDRSLPRWTCLGLQRVTHARHPPINGE